MLSKKASNTFAVLVMFWTGVITLLYMVQKHLLPTSYGAPLAWAFLVAMFFIPVLVVYVNKRNQVTELSLVDQILQLAFYASWLGLGFVFVFAHGDSSLLNSILSAALVLIAIILLKAVFVKKK